MQLFFRGTGCHPVGTAIRWQPVPRSSSWHRRSRGSYQRRDAALAGCRGNNGCARRSGANLADFSLDDTACLAIKSHQRFGGMTMLPTRTHPPGTWLIRGASAALTVLLAAVLLLGSAPAQVPDKAK